MEETSNKDLQYAWIPPRPSARHITPAFQLEQDSIGHHGNNPVWSGPPFHLEVRHLQVVEIVVKNFSMMGCDQGATTPSYWAGRLA